MNLRSTIERKRDFSQETSLWHPLFLQLNFAIKAAKEYFDNLPDEYLSIYDFGCGSKPYEIFCTNKNYIGIDINKKNIKADIHADVCKVPVDDNVADRVVSFYLLEHVENPQKVIDEKYRILKESGELFMLVPLYWEEHEQPYDFFRFTRFSIEIMMKKSGFKNIGIREINSSPSILGMHLARFFNRGFLKVIVPVVNLIFYKLELRTQRKARINGNTISNVMTFSVKGKK